LDGWDSVDEHTAQWRSRYGLVLHRNAFDSPSIVEPGGEKKYPFLVSQKSIDAILLEENGVRTSPRVATMLCGFPPAQGLERSLISEREIITFKAQDKATWHNNSLPVKLAALDPAYTADGDQCIYRTATMGRDASEHAVLELGPPIPIVIDAASSRPVCYQISDAVAGFLKADGIGIADMAVDDSGTQSVADVLTNEIGMGITRYNYALRPSERAISMANTTASNLRFKNSMTELWALLAEFVRHSQLRGLDAATVKQLTQRRFRRLVATTLRGLESKGEFKKRTGNRSPDEADCAAMLCGLARDKYGFIPGGAPTVVMDSYPTAGGHIAQSIVGVKRFSKNYLAPSGIGRLSSYLRSGK
jgi:hypothetical protein